MSDTDFEREFEFPTSGRDLADLGREVQFIREDQGISIAQVSEATRIRIPHIEAIEEGRLDDLPGRVYARGFLRSYLSFLQATELWPEYDRLLPLDSRPGLSEVTGSVHPPAKGFRRHSRWWLYVLLILGLVVSVVLVWNRHSTVNAPEGSGAESAPAVISETKATGENTGTAEVPEEGIPIIEEAPTSEDRILMEGSIPISGDASLASATESSEDLEWLKVLSVDMKAVEEARKQEPVVTDALTLDFTGACWLRIREGEKTIFQGTLKAGDSRTYEITQSTSVRFGNASAVNVSWRGEEFAPLTKRAAVLEVVFNPGESLKRP